MSQILKTKNYEIFKKHENNCPLDALNLSKIKASIMSRNLLEMRPILVDAQMRVLDGQHRLEAAKALEVDIYYQIKMEGNHEDIVLLNTNQRIWGRSEYLNYYVSLGNHDYRQLADFCKRRALTINEALSIFRSQAGLQEKRSFALGGFKFPPDEEMTVLEQNIDKTECILAQLEKYMINNKKIVRSIKAKIALLKLVSNPECNPSVLIKKISYNVDAIHQCATSEFYYEMFRTIYNWNARSNIIE